MSSVFSVPQQIPGWPVPAVSAPGSAPPSALLDEEQHFYLSYPWCLNPYPTAAAVLVHLRGELDRLAQVDRPWQQQEVLGNVFLLSCALLGAADDYLRGPVFRLPRRAARLPFAHAGLWTVRQVTRLWHWRRSRQTLRWRKAWQTALDAYLPHFLAGTPVPGDALQQAAATLRGLLDWPLPADLLAEPTLIPSAFRKQDLTPQDILALGRQLMARFPDRQQAVLVIGLRTAGAYFAPLLQAFFRMEDYEKVESVTFRPNKGPSPREQEMLRRCAAAGYLAAVVDDPPGSGDTLVRALEPVRAAGFGCDRIAVLYPTHPRRRDWKSQPQSIALARLAVLTLEPEQWHKQQLLSPEKIELRLDEYYRQRGFSRARVLASSSADQITAQLEDAGEETRRIRLKRVFMVCLEHSDGRRERRLVLAKSVGWGWLSYHAFLAGQRLAQHVPPLLGLRDGILYQEWLPQAGAEAARDDRQAGIEAAASYAAARARLLPVPAMPRFAESAQHEGFALLSKALSKAYGGVAAAGLMRARVQRRLAELSCPVPAFIDARMRRCEWVHGPQGLLKTDYEHHGLGKNELNVTDPAYDLAEAVLHLDLEPQEEALLVRRYAAEAADPDVARRLFLYKLLAGTWARTAALKSLVYQPQLAHRQQDFHQRFLRAWHFLTVQAARHCGSLFSPGPPRWSGALVVLDVDGVIDRRVFGFPCTTAAGIQALALLHSHEQSLALDTARSVVEVQEYCRAYGLAGAVAEYGSYVWDAVEGRGQALVSPESAEQIERAREALSKVPGVFLDERHRHSIRAMIYEEDGPLPVPTLTVQQVLAAEGLDRLRYFQTTIDTTIVAREVDKGTGLEALCRWVGRPDMETIAVGDSEPDLALFRQARRSHAPAHIACARPARLLGCRIARSSYQRGLLDVARSLVHADGATCPRCSASWRPGRQGDNLFMDLLVAADQGRLAGLWRALRDPLAWRVFTCC